MICKRHGHGWEIIYQRNHALLAAELLADWPLDQRPEPWFQMLNACSQHDHGWQENELDSLVDEQGRPVDFLHMSTESSIVMSRRNLRNAEVQSRWCAVLVARHLEYIFAFKDEPETHAFIAECRDQRQGWMAEIGAEESQVEALYELLCWGDTLSLLVCCPPSEFTESLRLTAQGRDYQAQERSEGLWTLDPWPYRSPSLKLEYEVRHLPQSRFENAEALREALRQTAVTQKKVEFRP
jgi:hypothetical protein